MSRRIWIRAAVRASGALLATGCYLLPSSGLTNYGGLSPTGPGYIFMNGGTQTTNSNTPSTSLTGGGANPMGNFVSGGGTQTGTGGTLGSGGSSTGGSNLGMGSMGSTGGMFNYPPIYP